MRNACTALFSLLAAAGLAGTGAPALAATYLVQGSLGEAIPSFNAFTSHGSFDINTPVSIGRGLTYDQNGDATTPSVHMQTNILAEPFAFHGHSYVQIIKPFTSETDNREIRLTAASNAYVQGLQASITGPAGPVTATLNMHLSGQFGAGSSFTPNSLFDPRTDNVLTLSVRVNGNNVIDGQLGVSVTDGGAPDYFYSGKLVNFNGDMVLVSEPFTVAANSPFSIDVVFATIANITYAPNESFSAQSNIDFGNTLSFATDRPVFNVPNGYSAVSEEIGIVDNLAVNVPEPASVVWLVSAATVLACRRVRRPLSLDRQIAQA